MSTADDNYINDILELEPLLRAYLHKFASRPSDLEDLLQETYTRLLAISPQARVSINSTQGFALTTARNVALDGMRRKKAIPFDFVEDLNALPVSSDGDAVEQIVSTHQELARLAKAIADLPGRCAEVFTLRKIYGFSQQEIAKYCGISESTVEAHVVKAIRRCKEQFVDDDRVRQPGERAERRGFFWKGGQR